MRTLDEIAIQFQTDKASQFSRTYAKPHDYCRHMERFFAPMRDRAISLVEIGVGGGESIQTWLEYFPFAYVFGVDLNHSTNEWNTPDSSPHKRYIFINGDQSNSVFWKSFIKVHGGDWDIVIDDGSHVAGPTITTYNHLWPHLAPGGIYQIEDLHSMPDLSPFMGAINANVINGNGDVDAVYFARELVIMRKR
jgi:8-demethyl-8-alpha-L-rhamnosyltetracenomycin-C 2'-O-methyltransferase